MEILKLTSNELAKLAGIYGALILTAIAGLAASFAIGKAYPVLAGLGLVAFVLGLRHAFDADHIAAIDNTTRKLSQEKKRPLTVGMWFSLGHSAIVVLMVVALVLFTRAVVSEIPAMQSIGAVLGTAISGIFLLIIGAVNAAIVVDIYRVFKRMQSERLDENELNKLLDGRGLMSRLLAKRFKLINEPKEIFPVGVLFGLGFDTATEVALIAISVGVGASLAIPLWMILVLPILFTCGMVLVDTTDGVCAGVIYEWAFFKPVRKVFYNLTITVISVLVAVVIGMVELLQVASAELNLTGGFWAWLKALDFETLGIGIVALFIVSWIAAIAIYKYKGFDSAYAPG